MQSGMVFDAACEAAHPKAADDISEIPVRSPVEKRQFFMVTAFGHAGP